jgi:hypothetical protein
MTPTAKVSAVRAEIRTRHPAEFDDGFRTACLGPPADQPREKGGYPHGFYGWSKDQRDAWFCGWNAGRLHADEISKDKNDD